MTTPLPGNFAANLETIPLAALDDLLRRLSVPLDRINRNPPAGRAKEVAMVNAAFALVQAVSARRHAAIVVPPVPDTGAVLDSVTTIVNQAAQ